MKKERKDGDGDGERKQWVLGRGMKAWFLGFGKRRREHE